MMKRRPPAFATSIRWQSVNVVSQVLLQLLFIMLLARLIDKADFGIMSIALVVVGFIEIFAQIGIGPSLIQREQLDDRHIRAAMHFSLVLGVVFFGGLYASAPAIGAWFENELLTEVLRWISWSFILSSIALVPRSLLIRQMEFKRLFIAAMIAMVFGNLCVGLGLAYAGYGIWAYVAALLCQNALLGLAYWLMRPEGMPAVLGGWRGRDLGAMLRYGGQSTLFNWFNYASTKVDTLIVGEFNKSAAHAVDGWSNTGVYDRSAHLMSLPVTILGKLGDSVLFSGMSALQSDTKALNEVITRGLGLIAWIIFPGSLALAWFSTEVSVLILGASYAEAGPVVRILFLGVAFRSLIKLADAVVRATDRLIPAILIKVLYLLGMSIAAWFAMQKGLGIAGVAWAVTASTLAQFIFYFGWLAPKMKLSFHAVWLALKPGAFGWVLAIPGYLMIAAAIPDIFDANGQLHPMHLSMRVLSVVLWTCIVWAIVAMRFPHVVDGGDLELRKRWTAYFPRWVQNRIEQ